MKKTCFILAALIAVVFLVASCQRAKETEKKEVQVQEAQKEEVKQQTADEGQIPPKDKKKLPHKKESEIVAFKRAQECDERYKKYLMIDREPTTDKERAYLWDVCKIPISRFNEPISPLKWWNDDYGYEDLISEAFLYYLKMEKYSEIKSEYIEPIKNIALNSKYPKLRERAIIVLHGIDKKRSIPILKEVLRKDVEERKVTEKNRFVTDTIGRILSEDGEYEHIFPYLMKARSFEMASKKDDKRAIPYMYKALVEVDPCRKVRTAKWLVDMDEKNDAINNALIDMLKKTKDINYKSGDARTPVPGGCRINAVELLGELKDRRSLPLLEELQKGEFSGPYTSEVIEKVIQEIKGGNK